MPVWLWPNLLSLDAPLVALLWQLLFLRCLAPAGQTDSSQLVAAVLLAMAVWLIYAADRMLDAWTGAGTRARHEFYRRNWRRVLPIWFAVFFAGVALALLGLSRMMIERGLELTAGALLYLLVVHARSGPLRAGFKEAGVAAVFALGTTLVAWPSIHHVSDVLAVAMFALLCWINCTVIEDWEQGKPARWLVMAGAAAVGLGAAFLLRTDRPVLGAAEATAALLLILVDRWREPIDRSAEGAAALRVLADVALLSPLLFLPLAGRVF